MKTEEISAIIARNNGREGNLIAILTEIQSRYSYLPREALELVSRMTRRSLVEIYGVATFYRSFSLVPRGRHLVSVCLGTACHVRGGPRVAAEISKQLGVLPGETTPDREFSFETVNCLGACALGPIVVIDGAYHSQMTSVKVAKLLAQVRDGQQVKSEPGRDERLFALSVNCPRCNHTLMDEGCFIDGYPSIRVTISSGRTHQRLNLSSLYGSYNIAMETTIPEQTEVQFFCPHCHGELRGSVTCMLCGARMVPLWVRGGGVVQVCSRKGCRNHQLDLKGMEV